MDSAAWLDELRRTAVLWRMGAGDFAATVDAACAGLAAGADGYALAVLAAEPPGPPLLFADADEKLQAALVEQNRSAPARGTPECEQEAVFARAADVLSGAVTPRELAAWAHQVIGHRGVASTQWLVELDDRYDCLSESAEEATQLDAEIISFCRAVLNVPPDAVGGQV